MRPMSSISVALALVLVSCGGSDEATLRIAFDGSNCTYEGPTELTAGPVSVDFVNESDSVFRVNLMRHTGDETVQEMVDYLGPEPSEKHQPSWVRDLGTWEFPVWTEDWPAFAGRTVRWEGDLEPSIYTMICASVHPTYGVWFGTGLTVSPA